MRLMHVCRPETEDEKNFMRFFKFGTVDGSILMMSILAGFSLEGTISRRIGAKVRALTIEGLQI